MLKIREGAEYEFLVEKELVTPDNARHLVLKGPDLRKYLIPLSVYMHYNINVGSKVKCRVDKINCKGEVFLEPHNPYYTEGESFPFEVVSHETRTDYLGIKHKVLIVKDLMGTRLPVPFDKEGPLPLKGSSLNLVVERISKGKVFLVRGSRSITDRYLKSGKEYEFVIAGIEKGMDDEEYFVVKDPFGNLHTIAKEFYQYYGYRIGSRFQGKIIKYKKGGEKIIEPENPFYKNGEMLQMDVISYSENVINKSFTLTLKDKFGFNYCIETASHPQKTHIQCRVIRIKKGKPMLEIM
jgi:hypothetical protein